MTNLEKLKKAIIKEIPEIVELKFGCYFSGEGVSNGLIVRMVNSHPFWFTADYHHKGSGILERDFDKRNVEVHGRDITLSDVLRVLRGKDAEKSRTIGNFWNLKKDNLSLQSDNLINFLTDLICKKDE